ncbi:type II toxin-antitoxin system HicB family antitoxin [Candidatus Palauibacter sp.]|uniref:type II toxin-antitoxin system HicB family antitoxin n=1 Tax=Candidatus Palauibacter sp. TaxID=3101350 RepID=UPI003B5C3072
MLQLTVAVVVEPDGDGFLAYCPAFKGLLMDGNTAEEALRRLSDGLTVYLDSLERRGDPIPVGPDCAIKVIQPPAESAGAVPVSTRIDIPCPAYATA